MRYRKAPLYEERVWIITERAAGISGTEERYEIEMVDMYRDHIHLLCGAHPKLFPGRIVQIFKSRTAREIFRKQPPVKKRRTQSPCTTPPSIVKTIMRCTTGYSTGVPNHARTAVVGDTNLLLT